MSGSRNPYVGHPRQTYGARALRIDEGRAVGSRLIEVYTEAGLELDILPDTGLDMGRCRFKGRNMSFMSKNGYDGAAAVLPYESEFLNHFPGGMLYTCGLRNTGGACRDEESGEFFPMHGRYHGLSAEELSVKVGNGFIYVSAVMRETALFGHVLELRREYKIPVKGSEIELTDTISNLGTKDEEWMLLYHINFGYPLLAAEAKLVLPEERKTWPRTDFSAERMDLISVFNEPVDNEPERCYFHDLDKTSVRLENQQLGVAAHLSWNKEVLPHLIEWRSMATGDYALGLEPSNSFIMGRVEERKNGTLPVLKAGEQIKSRIVLQFMDV